MAMSGIAGEGSSAPDLVSASISAQISPLDLAMHSTYFSNLFDSFERWPEDTENLRRLPVGIATRQEHLHTIVAGLYATQITLAADPIEEVLRVADYLGMSCIVDACQIYITDNVLPLHPLEVRVCGWLTSALQAVCWN